jgi:hypothetical protein
MISLAFRLVKLLRLGIGQFGHSPSGAGEAEVQARVQGRVASDYKRIFAWRFGGNL